MSLAAQILRHWRAQILHTSLFFDTDQKILESSDNVIITLDNIIFFMFLTRWPQ